MRSGPHSWTLARLPDSSALSGGGRQTPPRHSPAISVASGAGAGPPAGRCSAVPEPPAVGGTASWRPGRGLGRSSSPDPVPEPSKLRHKCTDPGPTGSWVLSRSHGGRTGHLERTRTLRRCSAPGMTVSGSRAARWPHSPAPLRSVWSWVSPSASQFHRPHLHSQDLRNPCPTTR